MVAGARTLGNVVTSLEEMYYGCRYVAHDVAHGPEGQLFGGEPFTYVRGRFWASPTRSDNMDGPVLRRPRVDGPSSLQVLVTPPDALSRQIQEEALEVYHLGFGSDGKRLPDTTIEVRPVFG